MRGHHGRRWTDAQVRALRDDYRSGKVSMYALAVQEGRTTSRISEMLTGVTFPHVPGALTLAERKAMSKQGFRLNVWNADDQTVIPV